MDLPLSGSILAGERQQVQCLLLGGMSLMRSMLLRHNIRRTATEQSSYPAFPGFSFCWYSQATAVA
jgi:hypothetical protein